MAGPAQAAKKVLLEATASTIGGPMTLVIEAPADAVASFDDPLNVCVTLVNNGKTEVTIDLIRFTPAANRLWQVSEGRAYTACSPAIEQVSILCANDSGCPVTYRIDRY
jgi:hypothetical protein